MVHAPVLSVATVRVNAISVCVTVTVTPGSTAPLSSVTRPASAAVACAQATPLSNTKLTATTTEKLRRPRLITQSSPRGNGDLHPGVRERAECYTQTQKPLHVRFGRVASCRSSADSL